MSTTEELAEVATENVTDKKEKGAGDAKTDVKGQKRAAEVNSEDSKKLKKDHSDKENGEDKEVNDYEVEGEEGDDDDEEGAEGEGEDYDEEGEGEGEADEEEEGEGEGDDDDEDA